MSLEYTHYQIKDRQRELEAEGKHQRLANEFIQRNRQLQYRQFQRIVSIAIQSLVTILLSFERKLAQPAPTIDLHAECCTCN